MNHVTLHTPSCFSSCLTWGYSPTSQESQPLLSCRFDRALSFSLSVTIATDSCGKVLVSWLSERGMRLTTPFKYNWIKKACQCIVSCCSGSLDLAVSKHGEGGCFWENSGLLKTRALQSLTTKILNWLVCVWSKWVVFTQCHWERYQKSKHYHPSIRKELQKSFKKD